MDYEELVKRLRLLASVSPDRTTYTKAADAIEALMKERDQTAKALAWFENYDLQAVKAIRARIAELEARDD